MIIYMILLVALFVAAAFPVIFIVGVIGGTVTYFKLPKPPAGLNKRELEHYYNGGWKDYERIKELDAQLKEVEEKEFQLQIERNVEKIGHWEQQIENIDLLLIELETELLTETNSQKRISLMEKQLQLIDERFALQSKIDDLVR